MNLSIPTSRLHKTNHIFILERAKPRRVSNFHPANIHFNSCWATPITIRSTRRWFQKKLLSGSSRIGLVALLFGFEPTCKVFAYFWAAPSHPRIANSTCCVLCLSQIKSGHTGGAIHPRSDGKECIQRSEWAAVPAHPCSTIDAYVPHCNIAWRLGTDYVDLFQTHIWDPNTNIDELVDVFSEIVRSGKALYIGAATMPAWTFSAAIHKAAHRQLAVFASMQCEYNPGPRECERELLPLCRAEGLAVIPFSPIARGFLTCDRRAVEDGSERTRTDDYTRKHYYRAGDFAVLDAVQAVAKKHGTTASKVALAWTAGGRGVTAPISGPPRAPHVDDAVAALKLELAPQDIEGINSVYVPRAL